MACSYLVGKTIRWHDDDKALRLALILVAVHLIAMGLEGWLSPSGWNGGMPPISLVALVAALVPLFVKGKRVHGAHTPGR